LKKKKKLKISASKFLRTIMYMRFLLYCHVTYTSILLNETIGVVLVNLELLLFPYVENSEEACHLEDHALVSKKKRSG